MVDDLNLSLGHRDHMSIAKGTGKLRFIFAVYSLLPRGKGATTLFVHSSHAWQAPLFSSFLRDSSSLLPYRPL